MKMKLIFFAMMPAFFCQAQLKNFDKQHYVDLLKNGMYKQAIKELSAVRNKENGKCEAVDYFIGKAYCGSGNYGKGTEWFSNMIQHYKPGKEFKQYLEEEKGNCKPAASGGQGARPFIDRTIMGMITAMSGPEAGITGKLGRVRGGCNEEMIPEELSPVQSVTLEEMESRLFTLDQGQAAVAKYRSLLTKDYHVAISGRFILISYKTNVFDDNELKQTSEKLEKVYRFYLSHFNLRPSDKFFAVYLLPHSAYSTDGNILQQTAKLVHGIRIPDSNIGYSCLYDLSLLGVGISDANHLGTLCHELFHLVVRTDVGDVPCWMDEGIACVYETSTMKGDSLSGQVQNWRTSVLREAVRERENKIPRLRDFLMYSWKKFDGYDETEQKNKCVQAINYAYAKHLMLYLQKENKLTALVTAVKERNINFDPEEAGHIPTDIEIFEKAMNNSVDMVENEFAAWMKTTYDFSPYKTDPDAATETFLELWNTRNNQARFAMMAATGNQKKTWTEIKNKLDELKSKYDALTPPPTQEEIESSMGQTTQMPGELQEDHYTILNREKKMKGVDKLIAEIKVVEKRIKALEAERK